MSKLPGDQGYAAGWCINYIRISQSDACEAGVKYSTFDGVMPCFLNKDGTSKPGSVSCVHLRRPTPEEIALHEQWGDKRMDMLRTIMKGIQPWRKAHKDRSASEIVECPACKGRLHLSISGYNGHVHGQCETADCVSWME